MAAASKRDQHVLRNRIKGGTAINGVYRVIREAQHADKDDVPALRLQMDGYLGLLRKVLPDLKAVEHEGNVGSLPLLIMADLGGAIPHDENGEAIDGEFTTIAGDRVRLGHADNSSDYSGSDDEDTGAETVQSSDDEDFEHIFT